MRLIVSVAFGTALSLLACHSLPVQCDVPPIPFDIAPTDTTVAVSDTFRMRVTLHPSVCWGSALDSGVRWRSLDTTIAVIDSVSGLLTARGKGGATIGAHLPNYGSDFRQMSLTVTGP